MMALVSLIRRVFAIVMIAIVAHMTMATLPLLMRRRPCRCQDGVVALITMASLPLIHNGNVALIAMASLPSSSWRCSPCCNGIIVNINEQASSLSS
jgi:hypothetical protein